VEYFRRKEHRREFRCIHEEITGRLKTGNACYYSAQNLLPSCLLSKPKHTIFLPADLYGCETWSLTVKEENDSGCLKTGCSGEHMELSWRK
jgi:hypothetical protein